MFHSLSNPGWADGNVAELTRQLGKMVEPQNQCQPSPVLRAQWTPNYLVITNHLIRNKVLQILGEWVGLSMSLWRSLTWGPSRRRGRGRPRRGPSCRSCRPSCTGTPPRPLAGTPAPSCPRTKHGIGVEIRALDQNYKIKERESSHVRYTQFNL